MLNLFSKSILYQNFHLSLAPFLFISFPSNTLDISKSFIYHHLSFLVSIYIWLISFFILFCDFIQSWHGSLYCVWLLPHLLYFLCVMLFENCFSELGRTYILFCSRLVHIFDRGRILVDDWVHPFHALVVWISCSRLPLYCHLYFSLQLHVSLDFSVDGQIAQTEHFFLVLAEPIIKTCLLIPTVKELMRFLNFQLMFDETIHPQYMIVLSLQF